MKRAKVFMLAGSWIGGLDVVVGREERRDDAERGTIRTSSTGSTASDTSHLEVMQCIKRVTRAVRPVRPGKGGTA